MDFRPLQAACPASIIADRAGSVDQTSGKGGSLLFELPLSTTLLVFGFPAFWILYTLGFLYFTRGWKRTERDREDTS